MNLPDHFEKLVYLLLQGEKIVLPVFQNNQAFKKMYTKKSEWLSVGGSLSQVAWVHIPPL